MQHWLGYLLLWRARWARSTSFWARVRYGREGIYSVLISQLKHLTMDCQHNSVLYYWPTISAWVTWPMQQASWPQKITRAASRPVHSWANGPQSACPRGDFLKHSAEFMHIIKSVNVRVLCEFHFIECNKSYHCMYTCIQLHNFTATAIVKDYLYCHMSFKIYYETHIIQVQFRIFY